MALLTCFNAKILLVPSKYYRRARYRRHYPPTSKNNKNQLTMAAVRVEAETKVSSFQSLFR